MSLGAVGYNGGNVPKGLAREVDGLDASEA